jgi:Uma2 family endonuclease
MKDAPSTLVEGQQLDQPTFHALCEAMPPTIRAELIDGVVFMSGPIGLDHGEAEFPASMWIGYYAEHTPGVRALHNVTTILGLTGELQPDGLLRILPECGGQTWSEGGFLHGGPELVVEVAKATRYIDLGPKRREYASAGVREYVVRAVGPDEIYWFAQDEGELVRRAASEDGIYRSTVFPGLWLDPEALLEGDTRRLRALIDEGCATPEHRAFVARLEAARHTPRV